MDIYVKPADNKNDDRGPLAKVLYVIGIILLALVILAAAGVMVPRLFGVQEYAVVTGSMEPAVPTGSLVFVSRTDASKLVPGDIIAYKSGSGSETPIVHRVVENDVEAKELITKGDANSSEDIFPVGYDQVVGKVIFHVPLIGSLFNTTKNKWF